MLFEQFQHASIRFLAFSGALLAPVAHHILQQVSDLRCILLLWNDRRPAENRIGELTRNRLFEASLIGRDTVPRSGCHPIDFPRCELHTFNVAHA